MTEEKEYKELKPEDFSEEILKLNTKIIPFFKEYPLKTYKHNDFLIFEKVIKAMIQKKHLTDKGRKTIFQLISKMNRKKRRF